MRAVERIALCTLFVALLACTALAPGVPSAQTPQQMEYERQQREYWRAQERQRQEEERVRQLQLENARRQQEESNRAARQSTPGGSALQYPSTQDNPPSASPGGGGRTAAQSTATSERRYALPDHSYFVAQVPGDWKDQMRQAPNRQPPTIVLGPASGSPFQVLITPSWPATRGSAAQSRDELRAAVERVARSAKSWALESELPIREIQGRSGSGFYFSATERSPFASGGSFHISGKSHTALFSLE